jgi:hypothetical protein
MKSLFVRRVAVVLTSLGVLIPASALAVAGANVNSVTVGSQTGTLTEGTPGAVTYSISASGTGNGTVSWSVISPLPTDVTVGFVPATSPSGTSPWTTTMTATTTAATPAGSYSLIVQASGGAGAATSTATLTVSAAPAPDTTPDAFSFTDQTDVALNTVIESNTITVSGINAAAAISVTGGEYSVNGGAYTASSGSVNSGDMVKVHHTSSASNSTSVNTTLTIGGVSDTFTSTTMGAPVLTTIVVSPSEATISTTGTQQFTAQGYDQSEAAYATTTTWASSDIEVATIDPNTGLATATGVGTTTITATATGSSVSGTATLVVSSSPPTLTTITVSPSSATTTIGATQQFTADPRDQFGDAYATTTTWASNNTEVATIDANTGLATGVGTGTATITAMASGSSVSGTATLVVTVAPATHTLTYLAGSNGTITGSTTQIVIDGGSGTPVTAVADSGFHFVAWSDASTTNPRTDTNVTSDMTLTATFTEDSSGGDSGGRRRQSTVPAVQLEGCRPGSGDLFDITSGRSCTVPAVPGQVLGSSTFNFLVNLHRGMRHQDIARLQEILISDGFSIPAGATGFFGPQTLAAAKAYQKSRGIVQTGFVGPITRGQLNRELNGG